MALAIVSLIGCDAPPSDPDGRDSGPPVDAGPDAGPRPPDICDELGLARAPMRTSDVGTGFGDVAGDFTVQTTGGAWTLSEEWSGCESYVFFTHFPGSTDELIRSTPDLLFQEGPRNAQYFFLSDDADEGARRALMSELAAGLEEGFAFFLEGDAAAADFWRGRFHFVTDRATAIEGSVGAHLRDYLAWAATPEAAVDLGERGRAGAPLPVVFGIDRAQAFDPGGNLSPAVGQPPMLGMAAFLGHFYDYRAALEARLAGEEATIVTLLDERTTGRVFTREVELPDAAAMAAFDTLEVDIVIDCEHGNPFGCSEWDRIADVQLCADGAACAERREIARWITPYWRRGRQHYLIDATPFLGLLRDGGARSFFVELGPEWERATEWNAQVRLRFRTRTGEPRAIGAELAFRGGAFDATYNTREPMRFTPPADATRVELVTILSGHGQTSGDNCAEWCDHRHAFALNGTALPVIAHEGDRIGSDRGCAARASEGVMPGQWGNWAQSRAYWCPGLPVEARRDDITSLVTLGSENEMTYAGSLGAESEPRGGDIALSAYVVWYVGG